MQEVINDLDHVLNRLGTTSAPGAPADAIDRILQEPPRQTQAQSLRDHPAVIRFRKELADNHVAVDTLAQLLRLLRSAVDLYVASRPGRS